MRLFLIRHGTQISTLCNDNTSLSKQGKEEARLLGKRLASYSIDAVYSSDLLRAMETADIIIEQIMHRAKLVLEKQVHQGLRESDCGSLTGMSDDVIAKEYKEFMEGRFFVEEDWSYPQGESGQEVYDRVYKVVKEIIQRADIHNVVLVTHGMAIRSLLAGIVQKGQKDRLLFAKNFKRGSLTELFYDEKNNRFYLERFNDYSHLEQLEL